MKKSFLTAVVVASLFSNTCLCAEVENESIPKKEEGVVKKIGRIFHNLKERAQGKRGTLLDKIKRDLDIVEAVSRPVGSKKDTKTEHVHSINIAVSPEAADLIKLILGVSVVGGIVLLICKQSARQ